MALGGPPIYPARAYYLDPAVDPYRIFQYEATYQPPTDEQQEAYRLQFEELLRGQEEQARKLAAADARARELLLSKLTPEQKVSFEKGQEFLVRGSKGNLYRINCTSTTGNVTALRGSGPNSQVSLCAFPPGVPQHDIWLAQKLILESDEDVFLKQAISYGRPRFLRTLNFQ